MSDLFSWNKSIEVDNTDQTIERILNAYYIAHVSLVQAKFSFKSVSQRRIYESLLSVASNNYHKVNLNTLKKEDFVHEIFLKDYKIYGMKNERAFLDHLKKFFKNIKDHYFIPCKKIPLNVAHCDQEIVLFEETKSTGYNKKKKSFRFKLTSTAAKYLHHRKDNYRTCYLSLNKGVTTIFEFSLRRIFEAHVEKFVQDKKNNEANTSCFTSHGNEKNKTESFRFTSLNVPQISLPLHLLEDQKSIKNKSDFINKTVPKILSKLSNVFPYLLTMRLEYEDHHVLIDGEKVISEKTEKHKHEQRLEKIFIRVNEFPKTNLDNTFSKIIPYKNPITKPCKSKGNTKEVEIQQHLSKKNQEYEKLQRLVTARMRYLDKELIVKSLVNRFKPFLTTQFACVKEGDKHVVIGFAKTYKDRQIDGIKFFTYEECFLNKASVIQTHSSSLKSREANKLYMEFGLIAERVLFNFLETNYDIDFVFEKIPDLAYYSRKKHKAVYATKHQIVAPESKKYDKENTQRKNNLKNYQEVFKEQCIKDNRYNFSESDLKLLKENKLKIHDLIKYKYSTTQPAAEVKEMTLPFLKQEEVPTAQSKQTKPTFSKPNRDLFYTEQRHRYIYDGQIKIQKIDAEIQRLKKLKKQDLQNSYIYKESIKELRAKKKELQEWIKHHEKELIKTNQYKKVRKLKHSKSILYSGIDKALNELKATKNNEEYSRVYWKFEVYHRDKRFSKPAQEYKIILDKKIKSSTYSSTKKEIKNTKKHIHNDS